MLHLGIIDNIDSITFSPDGKLALSARSNYNIFAELKLWDVKSGREIREFQIPPFKVEAVAFSYDSKLALSSTIDRIDMWNVNSGQKIRSFRGHSLAVDAVAFSPNGKLILSNAGNRTLILREVKTGRQIRSFKGHSLPITAMAFSPDGKFILSGADGYSQKDLGELKLWEVNSGREIRNFKVNLINIHLVAFSPDSKLALLLGWNNNPMLNILDITSGGEINNYSFQEQFYQTMALSPDGKLVLLGGGGWRGGSKGVAPIIELELLDIKTGRKVRTFQGESNINMAVAVSSDGKFALSGGLDHKLKLWNIKSGRKIHTFQGHSGIVQALAFSPNGELALSGSNDNTLKLWDIKSGRNIRTFQGHLDSVDTVAFSPDGKLALSGSLDSTVRLWNVQTGEEVAKMVNFIDGEWITITPEGYYMASLNGAKYLNVRVGNQIYGIDQYEAIYHRPDIVKLALEIGDSQKAIAQTIRRATQFAEVQPPKIWFIAPQNGYETDRSSVKVQVKTQDIADTADTISFTVNQRPVGTEKGKRVLPTIAGANVNTYTKQIPLQVGENKIQAIVRSNAGAVQRTLPLLVMRKGMSKELPKLYYLGIGVAQHPQMPLKYPVKDVKGLETVLKQQQGKAYRRVITKTLTNQEATRSNIINTITTFFKPVKRGDIAILFISGHGMNTDLGYHFLTSDANPDKLESTGASWKIFNAINKLKAHVLLLADTCHAGNIVGNSDWQARAKVDPSQFLREANLHNVIVLASSSGAGVSQEDPSWGHGAFTKALIEGLAGKAAYKKGVVKLSYLQDYVKERVPALTDNSQHPTIPRITGSGEFLELVLAIK